jgi:AcrR family transcriptional regulator
MARTWTPNQEAKREAILRAATEVLRTQGVAACTARSIASVSPLTKSALHYYFEDTDEIVDLAFRRLMEQYLARIEKAAADADGAVPALWAAVRAYLRFGADRPTTRRAPMLWFEYRVASARRGDRTTVNELSDRTAALFAELVRATGVPDAEARGATLFAALGGSIARDQLADGLSEEDRQAVLLDQLAVSLGLPR